MTGLEAIKARADAATRGPWAHVTSEEVKPGRFIEGEDGWFTVCSHDPDCGNSAEDFEFIAHAREDVPRLLAVAEAAQEYLDALDREHPAGTFDGQRIHSIDAKDNLRPALAVVDGQDDT